jgi:MtN3 and saliva related transmembrane protein
VDAITALGLVAAACTTAAFLPQVVKNWRSKSAGGLSFGTFGLFTFGVTLWLVYGLLIWSAPIIASNAVTLIINLANLGQMIWYRRRRGAHGHPSSAAGSPGQRRNS